MKRAARRYEQRLRNLTPDQREWLGECQLCGGQIQFGELCIMTGTGSVHDYCWDIVSPLRVYLNFREVMFNTNDQQLARELAVEFMPWLNGCEATSRFNAVMQKRWLARLAEIGG